MRNPTSLCLVSVAFLASVAACGGESASTPPPAAPAAPPPVVAVVDGIDDAAPLLRLPKDIRPTASRMTLKVVPDAKGFSGVTEIDLELEAARKVLWLHGKDLTVSKVTVTPAGGAPIDAVWKIAHESGVASVRPATTLPAGKATLRIEFEGQWGKGMQGLYVAKEAGLKYAFTQFEAIDARGAFPCFDEPRFKIPFTLTLDVPKGQAAVANTPEVGREAGPDGLDRVKFAATKPIPSYLVAFAAGPLDIVDNGPIAANGVRKRPLPFRGVAPKGRGKEMAYSMANTHAILKTLEEYVGIEYPYEKLDILAVPERGGAMENPGAVTFIEAALLFDEKSASVGQKRGYASVMAHELAHQWFGNLVTTAYWDDIWLNEAFATWLGTRTMQAWDKGTEGSLGLVASVQRTMEVDGLSSTRRIREPITSIHDIANAFDGITYQKGAGVLSMFERWLGPEVWQKGVNGYLQANAFKATTADDFLAAMSKAAGKDVAAPFRTFLDQPGVPVVDVTLACKDGPARLEVKQSRYMPLGSPEVKAQTWQIPFCAKFEAQGGTKEKCEVLAQSQVTIDLGTKTCPAWVLPNADASGYYRFGLDVAALDKLKAAKGLTGADKLALASALRAGFARGTTPAANIFGMLPTFVADEHAAVASAPGYFLERAHDWLEGSAEEKGVAAYARKLYAPLFAKVGFTAKAGETGEQAALRRDVVRILAEVGKDPALRKELAKGGKAYIGFGGDNAIHPEVVAPDLVDLALRVAVQEGGAPVFDAMLAQFSKTQDGRLRVRLLEAVGSTKDEQLAQKARELTFDERLRGPEVGVTIGRQMSSGPMREATWNWVQKRYDALADRLSAKRAAGIVGMGADYCDEGKAKELEAFFASRVQSVEGAPRRVAQVTESIRQCAAERASQEASVRQFFKGKG